MGRDNSYVEETVRAPSQGPKSRQKNLIPGTCVPRTQGGGKRLYNGYKEHNKVKG